MKREQASSIIWRCSTTASDATPRSITWLRWSSKLQQSPDRTVHRSWVASLAARNGRSATPRKFPGTGHLSKNLVTATREDADGAKTIHGDMHYFCRSGDLSRCKRRSCSGRGRGQGVACGGKTDCAVCVQA